MEFGPRLLTINYNDTLCRSRAGAVCLYHQVRTGCPSAAPAAEGQGRHYHTCNKHPGYPVPEHWAPVHDHHLPLRSKFLRGGDVDHQRGVPRGFGRVLRRPCSGVVPDNGERVLCRDELDERRVLGEDWAWLSHFPCSSRF